MDSSPQTQRIWESSDHRLHPIANVAKPAKRKDKPPDSISTLFFSSLYFSETIAKGMG
jgi:hypothetical protein